jgi:hypothetical protein
MNYKVNIELKDLQTFSHAVTANAVLTIEDSSQYCILTMSTHVHSNDVNIGVLDLKKKAANQFRRVIHNTLGSLDEAFPIVRHWSNEEATAPLKWETVSAGSSEVN